MCAGPPHSRAGPFASGTYSRTETHPDPVVIVVVVVVVAMVSAPADSDAYLVETGLWYMRAGAISGDMVPTLGRLLQCSQQVRLKLLKAVPRRVGTVELYFVVAPGEATGTY